MKLKFILFLLFAAAILFAQPKFSVENRSHDWGTVQEGNRTLRHTFVVVNKGTDTLRISNIRASCGCTVAKYDSIVAPGKTGKIMAEFDTRGRTGRQNNALTVHSNDPDSAQVRLNISVFIKTPLDIVQRWMNLYSARGVVNGTVTFLTTQSDFSVNNAQYVSNSGSSGNSTEPETINMTLKSKSGPDENGDFRHEFDFNFARTVDRYENGILKFETNIMQKPSISASVSIEPQRNAPY